MTSHGDRRGAPSGRVLLTPGDLLEIPVWEQRKGAIVYLGEFGRFGKAFGIITEFVPEEVNLDSWKPNSIYRFPLFTRDDFVRTGRWKKRCNRQDIAEQFSEPEQFYHPASALEAGEYGKYGLAETSLGAVRFLSRAEARAIYGVAPEEFREVYLPDELEEFARRLILRQRAGPKT